MADFLDPMGCSMPGFPVHHQHLELAQTHAHQDSNAIQPSYPLSPPSAPAFNLSQHQIFFQMSQFFPSGGQNIGAVSSKSVLPINIQECFLLGLTGWIPGSPRDCQKSSPTPEFKSINSLVLSFLYGPMFISIHDYWNNHSFD